MPLNKAKGNMYEFVTHTHNHLAGKCPHACSYCSVQDMAAHYPVLKEKYSGPLRLVEKEFAVNYGEGKTIFVENCNDLFAGKVPMNMILKVLEHCRKWPRNAYIFQTKNPFRYGELMQHDFPPDAIIGCTIESNRDSAIGYAPRQSYRGASMSHVLPMMKRFITIEPILDFDVESFAEIVKRIRPEFVNIGADSKNHGLPEPSIEKVMDLIGLITAAGIEVREKRNLERLKGGD